MEFLCQDMQHSLKRYSYFAFFVFAFCLIPTQLFADALRFNATATITASSNNLSGEIKLRYEGAEDIENIEIFLSGHGPLQSVYKLNKWSPNSEQKFTFSIPSEQSTPGSYHALLDIRYLYQGKKLSSALALEYGFGTYIPYSRKPAVEIKDNQVSWILNGIPATAVQLMLSSGPAWKIKNLPVTPTHKKIIYSGPTASLDPNTDYAQIAILSWVDNGTHYSLPLEWTINTDNFGQPHGRLEAVLPKSAEQFDAAPQEPAKQRAKGTINFDADANLHASKDLLEGEIAIELNADEPVYNAIITLFGEGDTQEISTIDFWAPATKKHLKFAVPSKQSLPGRYHAIVEIAFQDRAGGLLSVVLGFEYSVGTYLPNTHNPSVSFEGHTIKWNLDGLPEEAVQLRTTSGPTWNIINNPLTPSTSEIIAVARNQSPALSYWKYPQLARLGWIENGVYHSKLIEWQIQTDRHGYWNEFSKSATKSFFAIPERPWRSTTLLWGIAVILILIALKKGGYKLHKQPAEISTKRMELSGIFMLLILTAWLISHTRPDLWLTATWTTGGDTGSHIFYAKVFSDWFYQGKISGWLPESFAGYPAFTFYFPLPFILISLLDGMIDFKIAFKLINMSAPFLLPAATYFMGYLMQWTLVARILAATAAAGFIVSESTSIWGGNILATLAGEFSYGWGMFFTVLFWGVLVWSLRKGGLWWIAAALLEVLVALSHGYALLVAGFGAFFFLLFSQSLWRDLRLVLQTHALAFLLIGFWLMPLFENLPWTIPNDAAGWVDSWKMLLPPVLWPFALGIFSLSIIFFNNSLAKQLGPFIAISVTAFTAFLVGHHFGLADVRFFPFSQWAAAIIFAASFGYLLQRWNRAAMWWTAAIMAGMAAWWEPHINNMEGWSRWNLEGYEGKPMWPVYQTLANVTAGGISEPRVVFEHDPANDDLGSTRTLEALPLFGTRPMLEGLYMESALTGPFIYQLQTEISERPSSPLSRFPTIMGSMDQAIHHMEELYTDTLILRSELMKSRYQNDPRLQLIATTGPFIILKIKNFDRQLIETLNVPVKAATRKEWLRSAYRRFSTEHPYQMRELYLCDKETIPQFVPTSNNSNVKLIKMERERLIFETEAIGQPHLIRMTYHPRWKSTSGETVHLTEPAFMMLFPKQKRVELVYGFSWGNYVGWVFTSLGLLIMVAGFAFPKYLAIAPQSSSIETRSSLKPLLVTILLLVIIASAGWFLDPQRVYKSGHEHFRMNEWDQAAERFDQAYKGRKLHSEKAEALFWAALSHDLAGKEPAAEQRYTDLVAAYPENYWAPESLHRLIIIYKERGQQDKAIELMNKMKRSYPDNKWTKESLKIFESTENRL